MGRTSQHPLCARGQHDYQKNRTIVVLDGKIAPDAAATYVVDVCQRAGCGKKRPETRR